MLAGERTASVAPGPKHRGFIVDVESSSQRCNLPAADDLGGAGEPHHRIVSRPNGALRPTFRYRSKRPIGVRSTIAAAEEAHVPVPDEVVGPHPRS